MKKKYYNGHNQRKKNKNIVLVFPRSLLVHHRLSSMITKSMIFLFLTWHNYIFHIYTFLTYLTYRIFPFVSSCLLYLNAYLGDYIDCSQKYKYKYNIETVVRKKIYPLVLQPQHPPRKSIANLVALHYGHVAYIARVRKSSAMQIFNEHYVATDLQGIIMTFSRIYWDLYGMDTKTDTIAQKINRSK